MFAMVRESVRRRQQSAARRPGSTRARPTVEMLEPRHLPSVVLVTPDQDFHFADPAGVDQTIALNQGNARVTLADLDGGRHQIQAIRLVGGNGTGVELDVTTGVPILWGNVVGAVSIKGDLGWFQARKLTGEMDVKGSVQQFQARQVLDDVYIDGDLGDLRAGSFKGNLQVEGSLTGSVHVARDMDHIHVGLEYIEATGEYRPTGGMLQGTVQVGGNLGELHIAGLPSSGQVRVGGNLGQLDGVEVVGTLEGTIRVRGNVSDVNVSGGQGPGSVFQSGGRMGDVTFGADVRGQIWARGIASLTIKGCLTGQVHGIAVADIDQTCPAHS